MQKPILSTFGLGACGPINLIAQPDLKSTLHSPNQGVLPLKVLDSNQPEVDWIQPVHLPAIAPDQKLIELVTAHLTNNFLWNHFFPGLPKTNRSYLLTVQFEDGKLRIATILGSKDAFKKLGLSLS